MSQAKKETDRKDKIIRVLTIFVIVLMAMVANAQYLLATLPKDFECHFPPDLSKGGMVRVNEFQPHEVYAFALYLRQQTYRCEEDCAVEFDSNIKRYGYYYTDTYRPVLLSDAQKNESSNRKRVRSVGEFGSYTESKVTPLGNDTWVVYLDVIERETIGGKEVRRAVMRYPIRVVRHDVDRERNPWRLGIDGYFDEPKRLQ